MEKKITTLGTYTFERAQLIKGILESDGIECFLRNVNLIQGAISSGVKIRISEDNLVRAMKLVEAWLKVESDSVNEELFPPIPKILLPVDFSDYSRKAADLAFEWATVLKAEITLMHSYFDPVLNTLPFSDTYMYDLSLDEMALDLKEQGEKGLLKMKKYMMAKNADSTRNKVVVKSILVKGIAEDEILNISKLYKPTLIIMGSRGKDRKATDLIGSVTAEVIDLAKVPVLAIPEDFPFQGLSSIKNVLYVTNFQDSDFRAIDILEKLLQPIGVKIICAHVGISSKSGWDEVRMTGLKEYLKNKYNETNVVCDLIEHEDFWIGIESYIRNHNISVLCLTTHRRNIISRLLNPSIAKKMLFHSTTPLLVFHA